MVNISVLYIMRKSLKCPHQACSIQNSRRQPTQRDILIYFSNMNNKLLWKVFDDYEAYSIWWLQNFCNLQSRMLKHVYKTLKFSICTWILVTAQNDCKFANSNSQTKEEEANIIMWCLKENLSNISEHGPMHQLRRRNKGTYSNKLDWFEGITSECGGKFPSCYSFEDYRK